MSNQDTTTMERITFKAAIREGHVVAGGLRIAELTPDGHLVFEDSFRRRCAARGTDNVPVDLCDLMDTILDHLRDPQW